MEWADFFNEFIKAFDECDTDKDFMLVSTELTACLSNAAGKIT
jgi:hypothetical protein